MEEAPLTLTAPHENVRHSGAILALLLLTFFSLNDLHAQSIRIVRSDVDSGRASFITATQLFGMDIEVSGVNNCTGVSFELQYQGSQYVVFSDWKARDMGMQGSFAYDLSDTASGAGSVHIGALSGIAVTDPGIDNPVAIHLDFVVRPSAPNGTALTFSFNHAQAVTSDSGGMIVNLSSAPYQVSIHGFVNVFPGDADNNGLVDSRDATTVGAFLKQGSGASNVRGYKRQPCSTLWLPQEALVWDSAKATYADCDGSGDVTLSDNLVVQINFGKEHSKTKKDNEIQCVKRTPHVQDGVEQALFVQTPVDLVGAAFAFDFPVGSELPVDFVCADAAVNTSLFLPDPDAHRVYLVFGSEHGLNAVHSGLAGHLIYNQRTSPYSCSQAMGATAGGSFYSLSILSEVNEHSSDLGDTTNLFRYDQDDIVCNPLVHEVSLVDGLGRVVAHISQHDLGTELRLSTKAYAAGAYFLILRGEAGAESHGLILGH